MACLNCGTPIEKLPKKRDKVFCDSTCRTNYWKKVKRLESLGIGSEEIAKILSLSPAKKKDAKKETKVVGVPLPKGYVEVKEVMAVKGDGTTQKLTMAERIAEQKRILKLKK